MQSLGILSFILMCGLIQGYDLMPSQDAKPCQVKFEKVGCYKDTPERSLDVLLINNRFEMDWTKFQTSLERLACRCATMSKERGYSHFGLQFFAECWSGPNAETKFREFGESTQCVAKLGPKPCIKDSDEMCTGLSWTNFVYRIKEEKECKDLSSKCPTFARENLCTEQYSVVLKNCPKSCKLC